jgi:hypothetical protein
MVTRLVLPTLGSIFVVVSAIAIDLALSGAPALDAEARRAGVYGDWRVPDTAALYSAPDYLFQLAFAYLQADAVASAATEGPDQVADNATATTRAEIARDLLEESLALAPADAHAWAALAWAEAMLGHDARARTALDASWQLAPSNLPLAGQRVALVQVLEVLDPGAVPSNWSADGLARDVEAIERFGTGPLRDLLTER